MTLLRFAVKRSGVLSDKEVFSSAVETSDALFGKCLFDQKDAFQFGGREE